eukprot:3286703-Amphidinium_carterae.1
MRTTDHGTVRSDGVAFTASSINFVIDNLHCAVGPVSPALARPIISGPFGAAVNVSSLDYSKSPRGNGTLPITSWNMPSGKHQSFFEAEAAADIGEELGKLSHIASARL